MKLKIGKYEIYKTSRLHNTWIPVFALMLLGFCPASVYYWFKSYDQPNELQIAFQDCTCCPNARVLKGKVLIPPALKAKHPRVSDTIFEMNLTGHSPFDEIYADDSKYWLLQGSTPIWITGQVVAIDSFDCNDPSVENVPRFAVNAWAPAGYMPLFGYLNRWLTIGYFLLCLFGMPYFIYWLFWGWRREQTTAKAGR